MKLSSFNKTMTMVLFIMSFIFNNSCVFSQNNIGGIISTNTTLLASESPYTVNKNVLVLEGITLTIEPGVTLNFRDSIFMQVSGTLRAVGTEEKPILFKGMPGDSYYGWMGQFGHGWYGLYFSDSATDYDTLTGEGCTIQHAQISRVMGGMWLSGTGADVISSNPLFFSRCSPFVSHTEIAFYTGYIGADASNAIIRNCNIHDAHTGIAVNPYTYSYNTKPIIENNFFHDFTGRGFGVIDYAFATWGPVKFANNCIQNSSCEYGVAIFDNGAEVINNSFSNCSNVAVGNESVSSTYKVAGNSFTNNRINMTFSECVRTPQIYGNNFNSYSEYNIYARKANEICAPIPSYYEMDLKNNYWGGLAPEEIDQSIFDYNDDFLHKIVVVYDNFSMTPFDIENPLACDFEDQLDGNENSVSIHENEISSLNIWPNPISSNDILNLSVNQSGTYQLKITNMTGQIVHQSERIITANEIIHQPLVNMASGTYIISLTSDRQHYTQRIILTGN
jgi:hypothetical protein